MPERLTCEDLAERALIERYLAGQLTEDQVEALESHYLMCDRCQTELRLVAVVRDVLAGVEETAHEVELLTAPSQAASAAGRTTHAARRIPGRRRAGRWTAAAAAAAAVIVGLLLLRPGAVDLELPSVHREAVRETAVPRPLHPIGEVAAVSEFRWAPVPSADLYRVTVYDTSGRVILEVETADVSLLPPEDTPLRAGGRYLWTVAARVEWTRWVGSGLVRFDLTGP